MKSCGLLLSALVLIGCGSSSTPAPPDLAVAGSGGNGPVDMAGQKGLSLTIAVPSSLSGTPRQLVIAAFDQFPVAGPPAGILYQGSPAIMAGKSVTVSGDATGLSGAKYVLAVLYMQGGGQLAPTANVDYVSAPQQVTFGGGAVATAPFALMLLSPDGGF